MDRFARASVQSAHRSRGTREQCRKKFRDIENFDFRSFWVLICKNGELRTVVGNRRRISGSVCHFPGEKDRYEELSVTGFVVESAIRTVQRGTGLAIVPAKIRTIRDRCTVTLHTRYSVESTKT